MVLSSILCARHSCVPVGSCDDYFSRESQDVSPLSRRLSVLLRSDILVERNLENGFVSKVTEYADPSSDWRCMCFPGACATVSPKQLGSFRLRRGLYVRFPGIFFCRSRSTQYACSTPVGGQLSRYFQLLDCSAFALDGEPASFCEYGPVTCGMDRERPGRFK